MIDENRLKSNLESFSFPRFYGSEAEKKSFNLAKARIEELNITPKTQEFSFSNFYSLYYGRIMAILVFGILALPYFNIDGLIFFISYISIFSLLIIVIVYFQNPDRIGM